MSELNWDTSPSHLLKNCHLGNSTLQLFFLFPASIEFLAKNKKTKMKNNSAEGTMRQGWKDEDGVGVQELLPTGQVVITFAGQPALANRSAAL